MMDPLLAAVRKYRQSPSIAHFAACADGVYMDQRPNPGSVLCIKDVYKLETYGNFSDDGFFATSFLGVWCNKKGHFQGYILVAESDELEEQWAMPAYDYEK